ncbi:methyltransferase, partial [Bacillus sp. MBGLi97]
AASPLFTGCKWLVWFYRNKANLGNDWGRSHESILHFRKSKNFTFNIDTIRIPYNEHTLKYPKRKQAESSQYSGGKKRDAEW